MTAHARRTIETVRYTGAAFLFALTLIMGVILSPLVHAVDTPTIGLRLDNDTYAVGDTLQVEVFGQTDDEAVNAVEFFLSYSSASLEFVSFESSSSEFSIEAPGASPTSGTVSMARGSIQPLVGDDVAITTAEFTVIGAADIALSITADSRMLSVSDNSNVFIPTAASAVASTVSGASTQTGGDTAEEASSPSATAPADRSTPSFSPVESAGAIDVEDTDTVGSIDTAGVAEDAAEQAANTVSPASIGQRSVALAVVVIGAVLIALGYGYKRLAVQGVGAGRTSASPAVAPQQDALAPVRIQPGSEPTPSQHTASSNDDLESLLSQVHGAQQEGVTEVNPTNPNS